MSILRTLYPEKYRNSKENANNTINYYEKHRPFAMYHADTMEVILGNGNTIYQISIEDDYSRHYVSMEVFESKHRYFVIICMLKAFRQYGIPKLFHHDNGGEYDNATVKWLLKQFDITDVPTEVENPKGNGKKERAHGQDRKYFYEKHNFQTIEDVEEAIPDYLDFINNVKGQWARYGETASEPLKKAKSRRMSDEELEKVIRELCFEKKNRIVKKDGKVRFKGRQYHISKKLEGVTIEMRVILKGIEAWYGRKPIKGWKYWEYILNIAVVYIFERYLL
ncbi:MAG: hypothetical protein A7316_03995 [Candidatus Altiarchaeales archaeon WOR_SM1_86-2]|nr:MAG: hypothetical protein A7316_03995 [Candidatus Altiarchaeales archaeon WOR_SM1_86-2]ODS39154.1 MAG: hypothetical protein A7315_11465 [Candidatus Altiarchaeales archaeon WOR_SM1_79]